MSVHKWLFCPNSSLLSKFNPRNINYMPVVKFIERLDLEQNISFLDRHYLTAGGKLRSINSCLFVRKSLAIRLYWQSSCKARPIFQVATGNTACCLPSRLSVKIPSRNKVVFPRQSRGARFFIFRTRQVWYIRFHHVELVAKVPVPRSIRSKISDFPIKRGALCQKTSFSCHSYMCS